MISEFQRRILPENKKLTHVLSLLKTKVPDDSEITSVNVDVSLINLMIKILFFFCFKFIIIKTLPKVMEEINI